MLKPVLTTKLQNALIRALPNNTQYAIDIKVVQGPYKGCSGFITNLENNVCIYINTEPLRTPSLGMLYRYAEQPGEYTGGVNHFTQSLDALAKAVAFMLFDPQRAEAELAVCGKHYKGTVPIERFSKD